MGADLFRLVPFFSFLVILTRGRNRHPPFQPWKNAVPISDWLVTSGAVADVMLPEMATGFTSFSVHNITLIYFSMHRKPKARGAFAPRAFYRSHHLDAATGEPCSPLHAPLSGHIRGEGLLYQLLQRAVQLPEPGEIFPQLAHGPAVFSRSACLVDQHLIDVAQILQLLD